MHPRAGAPTERGGYKGQAPARASLSPRRSVAVIVGKHRLEADATCATRFASMGGL